MSQNTSTKLQLRYGGCSGCLSSSKALLGFYGLKANLDYIVTFHDEHRKDEIYQKHPEFLESYVGAILYHPGKGAWINLYNSTGNIYKRSDGFKAALDKLLS